MRAGLIWECEQPVKVCVRIRNGDMKTCPVCSVVFERKSDRSFSQFNTQLFCSRRCKGIKQKSPKFVHNRKHTASARAKMSAALIGKPSSMKGRRHSIETREKLRQLKLGAKSSLWIDGRSSNKEYQQFRSRMKMHRRRHAEGSHAFGQWYALKLAYRFTCPCCLRMEPEIKLTIDHILPIISGGNNNIENVQPLCGKCNSSKHTKTIAYPRPL